MTDLRPGTLGFPAQECPSLFPGVARISRFMPYLRSGLSLTFLLLLGGMDAPTAQAMPLRPQLLAQQVIDGLPPPPFPPGNSANPGIYGNPQQAQRSDRVYVVLVNGSSALLLNQVQLVERTAQVRIIDNRPVIQAGIYATEAIAQQQVQRLAAQGIRSSVAQTTLDNASGYNPPGGYPPGGSPGVGTYVLVIPSTLADLDRVSSQVIRLGQGFPSMQVTQERQSSLGPHVRVGPISGREAAERWNRYLRDFGLNSQIYSFR
ncbi:hypothetical protein ACQ4M4_10190 [Leptolyngbya sp. AN02str]|uniref:hypothetical protein n=1 Tax=Leptolyngbya sp. AN02str TaxID=3423363 RepID=UPI003D31206A